MDFGSSYNNLVCCCCEAVIGKMYHTTNQQMDMVRGNYSLLLHRLLSYQIGSCKQMTQTSEILKHMSLPSAFMHEMRVHMKKTQAVILSINERLTNVETCLNDDDDEQTDDLCQ